MIELAPTSSWLDEISIALCPAAGQACDQTFGLDLGPCGEGGFTHAYLLCSSTDLPGDFLAGYRPRIDLLPEEPLQQLQREGGICCTLPGQIIFHCSDSLPPEDGEPRDDTQRAIAAAEAASGAAAELLRFAREGEIGRNFAFAENTIEDLADALKLAIAIELPRIARPDRDCGADPDGKELLGQLDHALWRFLEDWR